MFWLPAVIGISFTNFKDNDLIFLVILSLLGPQWQSGNTLTSHL